MEYLLFSKQDSDMESFDKNYIKSIYIKDVKEIFFPEKKEIELHKIELSDFVKRLESGDSYAIRFLYTKTKYMTNVTRIGVDTFNSLKKISLSWGNANTDFISVANKIAKINIKEAIKHISDGIEWHKTGHIENFHTEIYLPESEEYFNQIKLDYGIAERKSIFWGIEKIDNNMLIDVMVNTYQEYLQSYSKGLLEPTPQFESEAEDVPVGFFGF